MCDSFLTGNSGKQCDNCGVCCHDACIKLAENKQRCKDVYSLNVRQSVHHWVKGKFKSIPHFIKMLCRIQKLFSMTYNY